MTFPSEIKQLVLFRNNNLAAVVGDDCIIRLFDVETRRVVRVFKGHDNRITDLVSGHLRPRRYLMLGF